MTCDSIHRTAHADRHDHVDTGHPRDVGWTAPLLSGSAAYCVAHGRDGEPEQAVLVCDIGADARTYANITDASTLASAEREELVGRRVRLTPTDVPLAGGDGNTTRNIAALD